MRMYQNDSTLACIQKRYLIMHFNFCITRIWRIGGCNGFMSWWRHQMETFFALLAICEGNSPVPGEFPAQRPVTRSFDVFFDLHLNKRLSKQLWGWWFETLSHPLWRHSNVQFTRHPLRSWMDCFKFGPHISINSAPGWVKFQGYGSNIRVTRSKLDVLLLLKCLLLTIL